MFGRGDAKRVLKTNPKSVKSGHGCLRDSALANLTTVRNSEKLRSSMLVNMM
jgi:hypothetical protein